MLHHCTGYGYDPTRETRKRGRYNGAVDLARAEAKIIDNGLVVANWAFDPDVMSDDWVTADDDYDGGHSNPWNTHCVYLESEKTGDVLASLGGIDFGRHGSPSDNYGRCCVASLATECLDTIEEEREADHANAVEIQQGCDDMKTVIKAAEDHANNLTCFTDERPAILAAVERMRLC